MSERIAHYRIEQEIGRGGMGVVYRCFDEKLRRKVAIKLLSDAYLSGGERRARILAEARAASALNHPAITTIYEVSETGDQYFIVMELITGQTLRTLLHQGRLEMDRVLRLAVQLAEGVAAAHAHGVIHGDLKPENVITLPDGRVKLLDFGVARHSHALQASPDSRLSELSTEDVSSSTGGTTAYMSPEQLRGEALDARSDLFSFGVMLYELCDGARPFGGASSAELISNILTRPAPRLDSTSTPAGLARIVRQLLEKDPAHRYQSAEELRVDLNNVERHLELAHVLPAAVIERPSVAVLPFQLLTPDPKDEYLSLALAEAAIHSLSSTGKNLVRSISAVMRYGGQRVDPSVVARELNVDRLVYGTIQKFGARLRVQLQVWDTHRDNVSASAKFDADVSDLFLLQDEISSWLSGDQGDADPAEKPVVAPPTLNATAYELYLRASERLFKLNLWDTRTAVDMLESVVKLDPKFVDAWGRLAGACVRMATVFEPTANWLARAERAVKRAISLDPANADALCAKGELLWTPAKRFQNKPALRALVRALRENPGQHRAQIWRGLILFHLGLHEEAEQGLLTALTTQPDDAFTFVFLSQVHMYRNHYRATESYLNRALALDPAHIWANVFFPTMYVYDQNLPLAEEKIRIARKYLPHDPWLTSCEALMMAKRGDTKLARKFLKQSYKAGKTLLHTHHMWHTQAAVHSLLGESREAVGLLKKASSLGLPNYPLFRDDPHFESLRTYAPYLAHMRLLKRQWDGYAREFGSSVMTSSTATTAKRAGRLHTELPL